MIFFIRYDSDAKITDDDAGDGRETDEDHNLPKKRKKDSSKSVNPKKRKLVQPHLVIK